MGERRGFSRLEAMARPTYHHVGTGRTRSDYWCSFCGGWYGVPHGPHTHAGPRWRHPDGCCCGRCLTPERREREGMVATHADYLAAWNGTADEEL